MTLHAGRWLFILVATGAVAAPGCSTVPADGRGTGGQTNQEPPPVVASGGTAPVGPFLPDGSLDHTDCFQGCNYCADGIHYSAPSHAAYDHDCCSIATQTVCTYGCDPRPYMGCLASPAFGGNAGAAN